MLQRIISDSIWKVVSCVGMLVPDRATWARVHRPTANTNGELEKMIRRRLKEIYTLRLNCHSWGDNRIVREYIKAAKPQWVERN